MKQLTITPGIEAAIRNAVGPDADLSDIAVFEAIALNTKSLPGKDGTLFKRAQVSYFTLKQMADSINSGNHLPLISNHDVTGTPKGRVFKGEVLSASEGHGELRVLFFIDGTEQDLRAKLNAGSLDEVSVSFLASQILCSECGFDYRGESATAENLYDRKCDQGHEIGRDGVHVRLVGLSVFTELSLVTRGAADTPKIVGQSQSKLAAPLQQLAAKGFEVDKLFLSASLGEESVDTTKLITDLTEAKADVKVLTAQKEQLEAGKTMLEAKISELTAKVVALEAQIGEDDTAAKLVAAQAVIDEMKTFLSECYGKLATASNKSGDAPESATDLIAGIRELNTSLTAILPLDGVSRNSDDVKSKFNVSTAGAFLSKL